MEGKASAWACRVCKELFLKKHWLYFQQEEGKHLREEWTAFCESWHRLQTRGWTCNRGSTLYFYFLHLLPSRWFCNVCIDSAILCSCCGWHSNLTGASSMFHTRIMYVKPKVFWKKDVYVCVSVSLYAMWMQMSLRVWSWSDQWVLGTEPSSSKRAAFSWVISLAPHKVFLMWLHFYCRFITQGQARNSGTVSANISFGYCDIQILDVWIRSKHSLKRLSRR